MAEIPNRHNRDVEGQCPYSASNSKEQVCSPLFLSLLNDKQWNLNLAENLDLKDTHFST